MLGSTSPPPLRQVFLYNLPEVATCHETLGIPSVSARFGTSPGIWNGAMWLLSKLPRAVNANRAFAAAAAAVGSGSGLRGWG